MPKNTCVAQYAAVVTFAVAVYVHTHAPTLEYACTVLYVETIIPPSGRMATGSMVPGIEKLKLRAPLGLMTNIMLPRVEKYVGKYILPAASSVGAA